MEPAGRDLVDDAFLSGRIPRHRPSLAVDEIVGKGAAPFSLGEVAAQPDPGAVLQPNGVVGSRWRQDTSPWG